MVLLDASALIAYALREPGWEHVEEALRRPVGISAVTMAEAVLKVERKLGTPFNVTPLLPPNLTILPFSLDNLWGTLKLPVRMLSNLSLGDRCCLGTAIAHKAQILTADTVWANLALDLDIRLIR